MTIATAKNPDTWVTDRAFSVSGHQLVQQEKDNENGAANKKKQQLVTRATTIYFPTSTEEVSQLLQKHSPHPISVVCGGKEASNVNLVAASNAIVLDLKHMKDITVQEGNNKKEVTVAGGVLLGELAEKVREAGGALPIGTWKNVGVMGYLLNGGLSGYYSRRLGLLSQCVERMTVVEASGGEIKHLSRDDDADEFFLRLGAGSALGVVTEVTLLMQDASILQVAKQFVFASPLQERLLQFARWALEFMRDQVLVNNESVSMETVLTETGVVVTVVFYDTFASSVADFIAPILSAAQDNAQLELTIDFEHRTWFEAASALWPIIAEMKGNPLVRTDHCCGTRGAPTNEQLDFVVQEWMAKAPFGTTDNTIVEARTLGGAIRTSANTAIPSGNCHHDFFVNLVTMMDAEHKTVGEIQTVCTQVETLLQRAKAQPGISVDFSGTHCQADDEANLVDASVIWGSEALAQQVRELKQQVDPLNRFQFHHFAKLLP